MARLRLATVDGGSGSGLTALAARLGMRGIRTDAAGLADAMAEALDYDGPAVVELVRRTA